MWTELCSRYDALRLIANSQGVSQFIIDAIKEKFFIRADDDWIADEGFWKPTGIALGYPFPDFLIQHFSVACHQILNALNLSSADYWLQQPEHFHTTVRSYSHYTERGFDPRILFPASELVKAQQIVAKFNPIMVTYRGLLITSDGTILATGFLKNNDLFLLREKLKKMITGITQRDFNLMHSKIGQLLIPLSSEKVTEINRAFSSLLIGEHTFQFATVCRGEKLYFTSTNTKSSDTFSP
ncbi:MAG: hypothetical protein A2103_02810 [Gammaproteobacteria bacterium GWF2_41_13]|nr:MAG: hypothetical protein A2103_02810 [Gammaproteobacteria bacterium GWF2_41_13]